VLEGFDQEECAEGSQGGALNLTHSATLPACPIAAFFHESPAHLFEQRFETGFGAGAALKAWPLLRIRCSLASDFVNGLVEFFDDMETVQNVESIGQKVRGTVEIGLPHVRAQEADAGTELLTENLKEVVDGGLGAIIADPKQSLAMRIDLINQSPELVFLANMNLIDTQSGDPGEIAVLDAKGDDPFDGTIDIGPGGPKTGGNFRPGKQARPLGQKEAEDIRVLVLR
jgi:hypothetical protein